MKTLKLIVAGLISLLLVQKVSAQELNMDLSGIVAQNTAYDAMAYQQAGQIAQQFLIDRTNYRMQTGDWSYIPGPVSPMDVSRSISQMNAAYQSYNDAWHDQSARHSAAVDRFVTAMQGNWYYTDPNTGTTQILPYSANSYTYDPQNGYVPGDTGGGASFVPSYGYPY